MNLLHVRAEVTLTHVPLVQLNSPVGAKEKERRGEEGRGEERRGEERRGEEKPTLIGINKENGHQVCTQVKEGEMKALYPYAEPRERST